MSPLQKFQIAFADYSAGHLTFDTLMACANEANAEHPNYVASLLQKFKMSKSTPATPPPESKGLDLEALDIGAIDEARSRLGIDRAHAPGCNVAACSCSGKVEDQKDMDAIRRLTDLYRQIRRLRAGAEGGK